MRIALALTGFVSVLHAAVVPAATINVPGSQPTIQQAINSANDGDEIVLAGGTYFEHINLLGKAITIRSIAPNDPAVVQSTIIHGGNDPVLPGFPQNVGTVVVCETGEGPDTVLLGLTITGGAAENSAGSLAGGGLRAYFASPTITNCRFVSNHTADPTARGGGIFSFDGNLTISGCSFINNSADDGGGAYLWLGNQTIINCTFQGNAAIDEGGGLGTFNNPSVTVIDSVFTNNTSGGTGAGAHIRTAVDNSVIMVGDCEFVDNSAGGNGGALLFLNGATSVTGCAFVNNSGDNGGAIAASHNNGVTMSQCTFESNAADNDGGALTMFMSDVTIADCQFTENSAGGNAGAMALNAILHVHSVTRCQFNGNIAVVNGGAAMASFGFIQFDICAFTGNQATIGDAGGLGIAHPDGFSLSACDFTGNSAGVHAGGLRIFSTDQVFEVDGCTFIANSAGQGSGGGAFFSADVGAAVRECKFISNSAPFGAGGGVYTSFSQDYLLFANCAFRGNSALVGGGLGGLAMSRFGNCLFAGNEATEGGGLVLECAPADIANCTFAGNTANLGGGFRFHCNFQPVELIQARGNIFWSNAAAIGPTGWLGPNIELAAAYSTFAGGQGAITLAGGILNWGGGNIEADPIFADSDGPDNDPSTHHDNNYRLGVGSPAIDAGDTSFVPSGLDTDLDGAQRFINALNYPPDSVVVDMGPYEAPENHAAPCTIDADGDGLCDDVDPCPNRRPGDVDGDGSTTAEDTGAFVIVTLDPGSANADDRCAADVFEDGIVDGQDVRSFISLLVAP